MRFFVGGVIAILCFASSDLQAASRKPKKVRQIPIPAALKGSPESLIAQNKGAEADGLPLVEDMDHLEELISQEVFEPISAVVVVDPRLDVGRRYVAPWVNQFLSDLVADFRREFPAADPLQVSSAVRTVVIQEHLREKIRGRRRNPNAAPARGEKASAHLRGATVDILHLKMPAAQKRWLMQKLAGLDIAGRLDAVYERRQAVFHVTVFKRYLAPDQAVLAAGQ